MRKNMVDPQHDSNFANALNDNGADGISDIEGKVARVATSKRGKRASFNGADGISNIEHVAIGISRG